MGATLIDTNRIKALRVAIRRLLLPPRLHQRSGTRPQNRADLALYPRCFAAVTLGKQCLRCRQQRKARIGGWG